MRELCRSMPAPGNSGKGRERERTRTRFFFFFLLAAAAAGGPYTQFFLASECSMAKPLFDSAGRALLEQSVKKQLVFVERKTVSGKAPQCACRSVFFFLAFSCLLSVGVAASQRGRFFFFFPPSRFFFSFFLLFRVALCVPVAPPFRPFTPQSTTPALSHDLSLRIVVHETPRARRFAPFSIAR